MSLLKPSGLPWLLVFLMAFPLAADPPKTIRYQARLTDDVGIPLDNKVNLTFAILDAESAGNVLWSETINGGGGAKWTMCESRSPSTS